MRTPTDHQFKILRCNPRRTIWFRFEDHGIEQEQFKNDRIFDYRTREYEAEMNDPKANPTGNTQKDPDDWVSGDEPMTGAQASYLKTLCEQRIRMRSTTS